MIWFAFVSKKLAATEIKACSMDSSKGCKATFNNSCLAWLGCGKYTTIHTYIQTKQVRFKYIIICLGFKFQYTLYT